MGHQSRLVLLLCCSWAVCQVAFAGTTPHSATLKIVKDDPKENEIDSEEEPTLPFHEISTNEKHHKLVEKSTTMKPVSPDILNDLLEASKHSPLLADDLRLNKMLADKAKWESSTPKSSKIDQYDYYDDEYYDDSYDDSTDKSTKTKKPTTSNDDKKHSFEMKPIHEEHNPHGLYADAVHTSDFKKSDSKHIDDISRFEYDDDLLDDEDEDEDDDEDDSEDEDDEEDDLNGSIIYNDHVQCPRHCVCTRNSNNYKVATCDRFDPGTQKFGADITDLVVSNVGPKYPILLGENFFSKMGLKLVSTIKISNCTIEFINKNAFHGLKELYAVNLTDVGLTLFNPDTFATNKKLRLLTISGNELSGMSELPYLLHSESLEELDLSHNNLNELKENAFSHVPNLVFINLSRNKLQKLPEKLFSNNKDLEELNLSYNNLATLPHNIFNNTSLANLQLKYNSFKDDLHFGTKQLQHLDLSYNMISEVHHTMFDKMPGLTHLFLRGNVISRISPDSFLTLEALRHIDLSMNELTQVSRMLFFKNTELDTIRLNDNAHLQRLPTDGFTSSDGVFNVYMLDISNCAISELGHKTFATMPQLNILKMSWNNINNIDHDTFFPLERLTDLDLSNNLITTLHNDLFVKNHDLSKLNLSGNTIRKLPTRLFLPLEKLKMLDVSDCELADILENDLTAEELKRFQLYDTLRSFNVSANQITNVNLTEIKRFKNLSTLDVTRNPLKCNENFQDFIAYVSLNSHITSYAQPQLSELKDDDSISLESIEMHRNWAQLAKKICKHVNESGDNAEETLEHRLEDYDRLITEDEYKIKSIYEKHNENNAEKKTEEKAVTESGVKYVDDDKAEEEEDEDNDDADSNDLDDDSSDDEDEEEEEEYDFSITKGKKKIIDHGVKVEEIDLRNETKNGYLINKFLTDAEKDDNNDDDDKDDEVEIFFQRGRIYDSDEKFILPIVIILATILAVLLLIVKVITHVLRKRGERYQMALLAASKNSIVYQKLTEDIATKLKETKQPKVHRYTPLNSV